MSDMTPRKAPNTIGPQDIDSRLDQLVTKIADKTCPGYTTKFDLGNNLIVRSYKFPESLYYKPKRLPTLARGLFIYSDQSGHSHVLARGYDKFFNIEETRNTKWADIKANTRGPYHATQKENGCIIFYAGTPDGRLVTASKQSLDSAHSKVGDEYIDKVLGSVGKTRQQLAEMLYKLNVTAVCELCDDRFEEHVLPYPPEKSGLYLHGLNANQYDFYTYPVDQVHDFAQQFGFKPIAYKDFNDLATLHVFLEECSKTGSWNGVPTEGFVIRCERKDPENVNDSDWHTFLFKYKFDEPYLLYRQLREITKSIISHTPYKVKRHQPISKKYAAYARKVIAANPQVAKDFLAGKGIIKMRQDFFDQLGESAEEAVHEEEEGEDPGTSYILIPIATIGCGKTAVSKALAYLFGWGHVQNDDVTIAKSKNSSLKKKGSSLFAELVVQAMELNPDHVAIADRNNSARRERHQIINDTQDASPLETIRYIYLSFVPPGTDNEHLFKVTYDRVTLRGDKHQTIQVSTLGEKKLCGIMNGFIARLEQPLPPDKGESYDLCIQLDFEKSVYDNLVTVIDTIIETFPNLIHQRPPDEQIAAAARKGMESATIHELKVGDEIIAKQRQSNNNNNDNDNKKQQKSHVVYYGVEISDPSKIISAVDIFLNNANNENNPLIEKIANNWNKIKKAGRIQKDLHVTLSHITQKKRDDVQASKAWDIISNTLDSLSLDSNTGGGDNKKSSSQQQPLLLTDVKILNICCSNERLICLEVQLITNQLEGINDLIDHPHITLGTASPEIKPVESKSLLTKLASGDNDDDQCIKVPLKFNTADGDNQLPLQVAHDGYIVLKDQKIRGY